MTLFDPGPPVEPARDPLEGLSADRRRTIRRRELLAAGVHPTSKAPLLEGRTTPETCGTCAHLVSHRRDRTFYKCELAPGGMTGGPATDTRVSWPACVKWEPPEEPDGDE